MPMCFYFSDKEFHTKGILKKVFLLFLNKKTDMRDLERTVEWLRPFVDTKVWDYCVVWKLGYDHSRFIEWMGCCCGGAGGNGDHAVVKEERGVEQHLTPLCRDVHLKHPLRTKACEALALFPSFMSLCSGIHGEVVTANQPRWLSHADALDSNPSHKSIGTRLFIPVFGGLIELFAAKHLPKDERIIELIIAHCSLSTEQVMSAGSYANVGVDNKRVDLFREENLYKCPPPVPSLTFIPNIQVISPETQLSAHSSYEGLSGGSNPSNEHPSFDSNYDCFAPNGPLKQSIQKSSGCKKSKYNNSVVKEQMGLVTGFDRKVVEVTKVAIQRPNTEQYRSKNLITERKRRNKINDGLFALRALVPKITKMNRAAILGDAVEYIKELQQERKTLQNELKVIEEQDLKQDNAEMKSSKLHGLHEYISPSEHNKSSPPFGKNGKTEVHVEVNQINKRDFLIKFICDQKRGGFLRLMEAVNSLELQVVDANITTINGKVLNILGVEAHKKEIQPKKLRDSLIELTGSTNQPANIN